MKIRIRAKTGRNITATPTTRAAISAIGMNGDTLLPVQMRITNRSNRPKTINSIACCHTCVGSSKRFVTVGSRFHRPVREFNTLSCTSWFMFALDPVAMINQAHGSETVWLLPVAVEWMGPPVFQRSVLLHSGKSLIVCSGHSGGFLLSGTQMEVYRAIESALSTRGALYVLSGTSFLPTECSGDSDRCISRADVWYFAGLLPHPIQENQAVGVSPQLCSEFHLVPCPLERLLRHHQ